MASSLKDFELRKAIAWKACHKLKQIWKSTMNRKLKIRIFRATIEIILLYGSETWTITKTFENKIDGCYTWLIIMILNISWRDNIPNKILYIGLPKILEVIRDRRMTIACHCVRHKDEACHDLILWKPRNGKRNRDRQPITCIDNLKNYTELDDVEEIRNFMSDREDWRKMKSGKVDISK